MKYEFPRAAQEGWLSRALPPVAPRSPARLGREEGRPPQGRPQVGLPALPVTRSPGQGPGPFTRGFGLWFSPEGRARADWPCLGELAALQARGRWWRWFPVWESLGSPNVGSCQTFGSSDSALDTC